MNFTKYENYRDSGLEWLAEIPKDWKFARIKDIGIVNARVGWKALKASEYVEKSDYFFLATPNIKYTEIDFENVNYLTKERYEESPEIMLEIDDILLAKDGSTLGTVNIVKYLPSKGTVNSSIAVLRFNKKYFNKYVFYQIKSTYLQNIINLKKDGAGVPHLFQKDINNFAILSPEYNTQIAIVNFLDGKTAKIDKKIELLQSKKKKYQELRKTLINEAVTKGLDKNVELKESGVKWIGKIPKHWDCSAIKRVTTIPVTDGPHETPELVDNGIPFISAESIKNNKIDFNKKRGFISLEEHERFCKKYKPKKGDIYMIKSGATTGNVAFVETDEEFSIWSPLAVIRVNPKLLEVKFTFYFMLSQRFFESVQLSWSMGTQQNIGMNVISNLLLTIPPKSEQSSIANYLDEKTNKIDAVITTIDKSIAALKELRKTLINDAVTGKIKVV